LSVNPLVELLTFRRSFPAVTTKVKLSAVVTTPSALWFTL
jgi:hypothetical protein